LCNVLLIGSGGREHALAWALTRSPRLGRFYASPGNPGIAEHTELIDLDVSDHTAVAAACKRLAIDLVVVGPEAPLVAGLVDDLGAAGIAAFGPGRVAAMLEGSKAFTKELCAESGIPTAAFGHFDNPGAARAYLRRHGAPIVVKANGLAAGKGVTVAATLEEAIAAVDACFEGAHGKAGATVVIEEFLTGEEASFFVLCDGSTALPFATAQDHKRVGDGDTGPNTGGMGAYSPAPILTPELIERTMAEIIRPTVAALARRGAPYRGVLYAGLMLTASGPKLIEYNVRFGDPETQAMMMRLDSDLLELMLASVEGRLDSVQARWSADFALTVVMAAKGYPGAYRRGGTIGGLVDAEAAGNIKVFQAGTALEDGRLVANGGRVLNVTARGATIAEARDRAYRALAKINFPDGFCRRDIGVRAVPEDGG
jgi:phosphoribosylamine--glycine ligase